MMLLGERAGRPVRIGWLVFLALMALTLLEYVLSLVMTTRNLPIMIVMNVIDAGLIIYFFMHVLRIWQGEKGEGA